MHFFLDSAQTVKIIPSSAFKFLSARDGGPKMAQNSTEMAQNGSKSPEWLKMALHEPKWP